MFTVGPAFWRGETGGIVSPITLNFDSLGVEESPSGVPIAGPFTESDVTVSGVWAYHPAMLDGFLDPSPDGASSGFVGNVSRTEGPEVVVIQLGATILGASRYIESITFDIWSGATITIEWFNSGGTLGSATLSTGSFGPYNTITRPSTPAVWSAVDEVERIQFSAGPGLIAVDNVSIALTS